MRFSSCVLLFLTSLRISHALLGSRWHLDELYKNNKINAASIETSLVDKKYGPFFFDQPVNHSDISAGTFKHRYWANTDWYHTGGPVILTNVGEANATPRANYVTNSSMALLAERLQGVVIVMEHRCYGESQLGPDYSAQYLRTLNTEQALEDMANIIKNVKLPGLKLPPAPDTKWIVYGGSYSGNLAAWMRYRYPDIVFAAVPSSSPVEMKYNYYEYFYPIWKYGPKHCIQATEHVIAYVDNILFGSAEEPKQRVKKRFGAKGLEYDDDFANCKYLLVSLFLSYLGQY
ncbi:serine carboxypeptidase S28-domain-containing protein [Circinella umbellata]|nr:serine carboxypeptidase S28-domain-containing protein [Circinella umbellata]